MGRCSSAGAPRPGRNSVFIGAAVGAANPGDGRQASGRRWRTAPPAPMRIGAKPSMIAAKSSLCEKSFMAQTRHILIVDDDAEVRQALGRTTGAARRICGLRRRGRRRPPRAAAPDRPARPHHHGRRPARHGRARGGPPDARGRLQASDHHADRARFGRRHGDRPRHRGQRLRRQAVPFRRAAGAHARCSCASTKRARTPNSRSVPTRSDPRQEPDRRQRRASCG